MTYYRDFFLLVFYILNCRYHEQHLCIFQYNDNDHKRTCNKYNQPRKKGMTQLTKEEKKIHREQKVCYICKKIFSTNDNKKYFKEKL